MHAEDQQPIELSDAQGESLLRLARRTIGDRLQRTSVLTGGFGPGSQGAGAPDDPVLQRHQATFITIKINGRLRGCMGSLTARETIIESLRHNAISAAFNDPRFPPLTNRELASATIEVSILSDPQPLAYDGADDLLQRLVPGRDGLIIRQGTAGATFLPQVWEQLPQPDDFLTHLCLKAGLNGHAWRLGRLEVSTYRVQHFEERAA